MCKKQEAEENNLSVEEPDPHLQSRFKRRSSPEGRSSRRAQLAGRPAGPPTEQGAQDPGPAGDRAAAPDADGARWPPGACQVCAKTSQGPISKEQKQMSRQRAPSPLPQNHEHPRGRRAAGPPTEAVLPVPDSSGPRRPEKLSGGTEPPPRTRPPCPRRPPLEHRPRAREPPAGGAAGSCHLRRPAEPGLWQRARPTQTLPTISSAK